MSTMKIRGERMTRIVSSKEMKPCPFCNTEQTRILDSENIRFFGYCFTCGAEGPPADDKDTAILLWNKRSARRR